MTPILRFIPFRSSEDRGWDDAMRLYLAAFPAKERRTAELHLCALDDPLFTADGIWLDDRFAGILYHWECGDSRYIEHLAVSPELRGRHLGSQILAAFCTARRVILEIEPPEDEISIRRLGFYERAGFVRNPQQYVHPSYAQPFEAHPLVLMSYPDALSDDEARVLADFVREKVLRYSEHVRPIQPILP